MNEKYDKLHALHDEVLKKLKEGQDTKGRSNKNDHQHNHVAPEKEHLLGMDHNHDHDTYSGADNGKLKLIDMLQTPCSAFVTFQTEEGFNRAVNEGDEPI